MGRARIADGTWLVVRVLVCGVAFAALSGCGSLTARLAPDPDPLPPQRFPRNASRFELRAQNDSTVSFSPAEASWVRVGMSGIAVNPSQGDALVARLRIVSVVADSAIAIVTGQTTRVSEGQVILLVAPAPLWWRDRRFWYGAAAGAAALVVASFTLLRL